MDAQLIQLHNAKAAATWDSGGPKYDRISHSISDGIAPAAVAVRMGQHGGHDGTNARTTFVYGLPTAASNRSTS